MIKISADSTVDLSKELVEKNDISIFSLHITLGDETFTDGVDICPDDLYAYADKTGSLAKTAAGGIAEYTDYFESIKGDGDRIIHFCISESMSSSFNNARLAAEEVGDVFVVNSQNLSTGIGLLVLRACDLAKSGMTAEEIVKDIEEKVPCVETSFVIDTLDYLYKGGRCSALARFGANLLSLKPCIEVKNGAMGVGKKYKGKINSVMPMYVKDRLVNLDDVLDDRVFITHTRCDGDTVKKIIETVRETGAFKEIHETMAGCTVSTHCGPNTLGILFIRKTPIA